MKKILLLLMLPVLSFAQEEKTKRESGEIKTNLFDLVVGESFNLGYEHFFKGNQALQVDITAFDTFSYLNAAYLDNNNVFSLQGSYNIYFSKSKQHHGFVFYPFAKYRIGTQEVGNYWFYDSNTGTSGTSTREFDLSGFEVGFGLGHKWLFNDRISLGIGSQLGRNLTSDSDFRNNYSDLNFKANVTLGVRF